MANTGLDHHDSLLEHVSPWALEVDCDGMALIRCATLAIVTETTITWPVNLCAVAAFMDQFCGNIGLVTWLASPCPLMQKKDI